MKKIVIRDYRDTDKENILEMLTQAFKSKFNSKYNFSNEDVKYFLNIFWDVVEEDNRYIHLVACIDQQVVGVILVQVKEVKSCKTHFIKLSIKFGFYKAFNILCTLNELSGLPFKKPYVEHVVVHNDYRNFGIGQHLFDSVEGRLISMNNNCYSLLVKKDNNAKRLYERLGFTYENLQIKKNNKSTEWYYMIKKL